MELADLLSWPALQLWDFLKKKGNLSQGEQIPSQNVIAPKICNVYP